MESLLGRRLAVIRQIPAIRSRSIFSESGKLNDGVTFEGGQMVSVC